MNPSARWMPVRKELRTWLRDIHHNLGVTSILVTRPRRSPEVSDEIVVMNHGKIEQTGSAEAIYRNPKTPSLPSS